MWTFDSNYNKWILNNDKLTISDFDYTAQELSAVRFYAKCLSGATYLPVNDLNNIYDILGDYQPRNWYVSILGSQYSNTLIPSKNPSPIDLDTSFDFYEKYLPEYGLTLKNLFTPTRLIKDSLNNYVYVDVATTVFITNFGTIQNSAINLTIDDIRLKEGHRVLVKDQTTIETLPNTVDPDTYFIGNYVILNNYGATIEYKYYNSDNGIYLYTNNTLVKQSDIDSYNNAKRFSVSVKQGTINGNKQFHLSRLLNGYYPISSNFTEPIEFIEKHNWILRNKVDYNNLFEINYYDVVKFGTQSYSIDSVTYSIPERTISVGEFGVILNHQGSISNLIANKYKVNLRSISSTTTHYWICGDNGVLLKVRKHDFNIEKVKIDGVNKSSLKSISFYDNLRGVVVGELNIIAVTQNGGHSWERINISDFAPYNYNKVVYYSPSSFFIGGNTGVFIEMKQDISGWTAYKRRVTRLIDDEDEYVLVDNINDLLYTKVDTWGLSYSYSTQSTATNKELLFIVSDDNKVIVHDVNNSIPGFDFVYLELSKDYDDIMNISRQGTSSNFYFTGLDVDSGDSGIFSFDLTDFSYIGVGNSYSNTISGTFATFESTYYPNEIFDYKGEDMVICGNTSLLRTSTYSTSLNFNILDTTFEDRLKAKLLFLDYDAASKLNFFDDFGQYRLPNSLTFSSASFSSNSYLEFKNITYNATYPSYVTQSEVNWFNYWSDREKTFEYYSNGLALDESTMILMSSTFSYSPTQSQLTISNISASESHFCDIYASGTGLAPTILDNGHTRFSGVGMTAISSPLTSHDLYIYDYLMVAKVSLSYPVALGDVMRFESKIVDGNFIVNKVEFPVNDPTNKYIYMFSEFNGNIIKDLQSTTYSVTLTNLNKYSTVSELEERFGNHSISNGYDLTYDSTSGVVEINPLFNYLTSYYNLATNVIVSGDYSTMSYTSGFLNFGYKPTYNLLDYLEGLNDIGDPNPKFYADKEYYAMPDYRGIPLQGAGNFLTSTAYLDYNGITYSTVIDQGGNKILFGIDLVLEWDSILINTFIDIRLYDSPVYSTSATYTETKRLLVMNKYFDVDNNAYVIEFHKNLNYNLYDAQYFVDIISRRKLSQISEDLQELNNIQRPKLKETELNPTPITGIYSSYDPELNFKVPTDSYAKVLLSDVDTIEELSAIIYIDDKNELSMNITRLEKELSIPITNTGEYLGNLFIFCSEKHGLKTGDGVNLEFNGGEGSSQFLNQDYIGYHTVVVVTEYNFYVNYPYGNYTLVGSDSGFAKYIKKDPFLNYEPVDLIDYGVDKKEKQSIEINIDNLSLSGDRFRLVDVDFTKYRFRLIDGLNIVDLSVKYPWILEAEISNATIGESDNDLVWYKGIWECGRWFSGRWVSGTWLSGDWYGGTWDSKLIKDNKLSVEIDETSSNLSQSIWYDGRWFDGNWSNGTWIRGRWYNGAWNNGIWYRGIWNDGTWNNGSFCGGIWVLGTWNNGIFNTDVEPAYWLDGKWYGGDFENGMWYNGLFDEKNDTSRFGINAYSSRTATWHGGKWVSGSFYSRLNLDDEGIPDVCDVHKYSIWYTGTWFKGDFYGGVAYNMDWKSGTWHGGILEDIQVIGLTGSTTTSENYFTLNGIFKFNIGDEITIIDNQVGGIYANAYGSNDSPDVYRVLYTVEDSVNKWTDVYVNRTITNSITPPVDAKLRVVSRFRESNWKTGIWTNGIFEKGLWEGGIWYNGVFEGTWM